MSHQTLKFLKFGHFKPTKKWTKFLEIINQTKQSKKKFIDEEFPPAPISISSDSIFKNN